MKPQGSPIPLPVIYFHSTNGGGWPVTNTTEIERLKHLVEASRMLNASLELGVILENILKLASSLLMAERSSLFLVDEERGELWTRVAQGTNDIRIPLSTGIAGHVATTNRALVTSNAYDLPFFNRDVDRVEGFVTRSVLCVPLRNRDGKVVGVLETLNKRDGIFDEEDSRFLEDLGSQAAVAIENALLHERLLRQKGLERDLHIAAQIQNNLLRTGIPEVPGLRLHAFCQPARHVGGDFFEYAQIPGGRVLLAIGDVAGKGIPAALMMSNILASLRTLSLFNLNPVELLDRLNGFVAERKTDLFCTAFLCEYDPACRILSFCNAGQTPPIHVRSTGKIHELRSGGLPLGLLPEGEYRLSTEAFEPGDLLFLYTDGIIEARNSDRELFGLPRLVRTLQGCARFSPDRVAQAVQREVTDFSRGVPQSDDFTLLVATMN